MELTPDQIRVLAKFADQLLADEQAAAERQAAIDAVEIALGEPTIEVTQPVSVSPAPVSAN